MQRCCCEGNRKVVLLLEIRRVSFWEVFEKLVGSVSTGPVVSKIHRL